jgi:hypothetical protein
VEDKNLDPAKRMRAIREWVERGGRGDPDSEPAGLVLSAKLNKLKDQITSVQARQALQEKPFVSSIPLLGHIIVKLRAAWNWMSTKWYVRPLIHQQNEFNASVTYMCDALLEYLQTVTFITHDVCSRVEHLESRLDALMRSQKIERPSLEPPVVSEDLPGIAESAVSDWCASWVPGPVAVLSDDEYSVARILAESEIEVYDTAPDGATGPSHLESFTSQVDWLASVSENTLQGIFVMEKCCPQLQDVVSLLNHCRRVLRPGGWLVWVWPWHITSGDADIQAVRSVAVGLEFQIVTLETHRQLDTNFQIFALQK